jgi:hypothetical protein
MRSADCGVRSADCGVRTAECGVRTADCGLRSADWEAARCACADNGWIILARAARMALDETRRTSPSSEPVRTVTDPISTPFDEFEHTKEPAPRDPRGIVVRWMLAGLRFISMVSLWVAIPTAACVLLGHVFRFPFAIKSSIPLIAIGLSYVSIIITLPRTPGQRLVGIFMGMAFMLWGAEQFLRDRALISFIDDCIVFLFVVDLSLVIRQNFRESDAKRRGGVGS